MIAKLVRFFTGDDVFISYARADASAYALSLANELTKRELSCFVDQWGTAPGDRLPSGLVRTLTRASLFVLLGSEHVATSEPVQREVEVFLRTGRTVIPISFEGSLERAPWFPLIRGLSIARETTAALRDGAPTDPVISRIVNAQGFTRRNKRLRRVFWATTGATAAVVAAGSLATYALWNEARAAQEATQLEIAGAGNLRLFRSGTGELQSLRAAIDNAERLAVLVRDTPNTSAFPAVSPLLAIQTILDEIKERRQLATHGQRIRAAAASRDGEHFAVVEGDEFMNGASTVHVWNRSNREIAVWPLPRGGVRSIGWSDDGRRLAVLSAQVEVGAMLIDSGSGKLLAQVANVLAWAVSADRSRVVAVASGGNVTLLHMTGEIAARTTVPAGTASVTFGSNGRVVLFWGDGPGVWLWRGSGDPPIQVKTDERVQYAGATADGDQVITAGPRAITIWTLEGKLQTRFDRPAAGRIAMHPSLPLVAVMDAQRSVVGLIDVARGSSVDIPETSTDVSLLELEPSGRFLVVGHATGAIEIRALNGELVAVLRGHQGRVQSVDVTTDGASALTASVDDTVRLWDLRDRSWRLSTEGALDVVFTHDGSTLTVEHDGRVRRWNAAGEEVASTQLADSLTLARFSADGTRLVIADAAQHLSVVEFGPDSTPRVVDKWSGYPVQVSLDREGRRAIVAEAGGRVSLREIGAGRDLPLQGHRGWVYGSAFSADGATLATVGADGTVRFWSSDGKEQSLADPGQGQVTDVQFSPDNQRFATAGADGTVRLRDRNGHEVARGLGHGGRVLSVRFTPDGDRLASLSLDGTIRMWDSTGRQVAEYHCSLAPRIREVSGGNFGDFGFAVAADGARLAATDAGGSVHIWPIDDLHQLLTRARNWIAN